MNIYNEAIKMIKDDYQASINMCIALEIKYKIKLTGVIETLERAKKVEEELEEYKISDKSKEESSIEYYNLYKETKRKLKKVEELLKLYELFKYKITHQEKAYYLLDEIDKLEKELDEKK